MLKTIGFVFATIYLVGMLCGALLAFWKIATGKTTKSLAEGAERFEMTFMWTVFWWFCLWNWLVHRHEPCNEDECNEHQ